MARPTGHIYYVKEFGLFAHSEDELKQKLSRVTNNGRKFNVQVYRHSRTDEMRLLKINTPTWKLQNLTEERAAHIP